MDKEAISRAVFTAIIIIVIIVLLYYLYTGLYAIIGRRHVENIIIYDGLAETRQRDVGVAIEHIREAVAANGGGVNRMVPQLNNEDLILINVMLDNGFFVNPDEVFNYDEIRHHLHNILVDEDITIADIYGLREQKHKKKVVIDDDDPDKVAKMIDANTEWSINTQNVHDSATTLLLQRQYTEVYNDNMKNSHSVGYEQIKQYYINTNPKLYKVFEFLDNNYPINYLNNINLDNKIISGVHEQDIIVNVYNRAFSEQNANNSANIIDALGRALEDCIEHDKVVCIGGRSLKIWQALARTDYNENIGVIRDKEMIKNEIFAESAKIVEGLLVNTSQNIVQDYNAGRETDATKKMVGEMTAGINGLKPKYKDLLPPIILDATVATCISVL